MGWDNNQENLVTRTVQFEVQLATDLQDSVGAALRAFWRGSFQEFEHLLGHRDAECVKVCWLLLGAACGRSVTSQSVEGRFT